MEDEELKFGPNGGLVFAMEFLLENQVLDSRNAHLRLDVIKMIPRSGWRRLWVKTRMTTSSSTVLVKLNFTLT